MATLFQVKIDEPVEVPADVEHAPDAVRPRHVEALDEYRKLGAHIGINDEAENMGAVVAPAFRQRRLHLCGTSCNDAGLAHLSGLTRLQFLVLDSHDEKAWTAAGLGHLRGLPINYLVISGHGLDDEAVGPLNGLRLARLKVLTPHHISAEKVKELRVQLDRVYSAERFD